MAESVVFDLQRKFEPFLQEEVKLLIGVGEEIEYIRDEFERMTAFLRVADAMEETDPRLAVWVKQVREAAHDTGDVLDMYMLHLGHHHGNGVLGFLHKVALLGDGLRMLTLLDLEGTQLEAFPNEVVKLCHLRHLSLRRTKLRTIPKSIGNLQNLETLNLKQTQVTELPDEILKLQRLRHLLLYRCYRRFDYRRGFKAPMGIGSLSSLQKLCSIEVNHDNNNGIVLREVGKLTQLRRVQILKLMREDCKVLCSSLEKLKNLRSLRVSAVQEDEIIDLDSLSSPPQRLRMLWIIGHLQRLPRWIPSAFNLAYVGEELCFKAGAFQNLETLSLATLEELIWVRVEASSMPRLKTLSLVKCKLMEEIPSGIEHLTNLEKLDLLGMSDNLISRLNRDLQGGDYWKVSHIPHVSIGIWKDDDWERSFLS
ncbi:hypothetical protein Acr_25g0010150 [Actinidia rufa]|uniref:Rx N-terminal domain-containing protein n=1 Tax=Actinidia rufa TaxID=165716 RepID=A0A7J0H0M4_9ERIC|nr:hypothetical protein Acr_25g0010150 [Actinidia rufa]